MNGNKSLDDLSHTLTKHGDDKEKEKEGKDEEAKPWTIKSTCILFSDLPPSCVEFSPLRPEILLVGTYLLERGNCLNVDSEGEQGGSVAELGQESEGEGHAQERRGSLAVYELIGSDLFQRVVMPTDYAILDLHFWHEDASLFTVATSSGTIELFQLELNSSAEPAIKSVRSFRICDASLLVLSLNWAPSGHSQGPCIAYTLSSGEVGFLHWSDEEFTTTIVDEHSLEAWIAVWSSSINDGGRQSLYSGGDDSVLAKLQVETAGNATLPRSLYTPVPMTTMSDQKTHQAGVTAILPLPRLSAKSDLSDSGGRGSDEVILTGSYDEYIRVLTLKNGARRFTVLSKKRLGGGVWRLKILEPLAAQHHPAKVPNNSQGSKTEPRSVKVLASCMHAGAKILELQRSFEGQWSIKVLASFVEHESMNYASDFCRSPLDKERGTTVVSTSFYDRRICVWAMPFGSP